MSSMNNVIKPKIISLGCAFPENSEDQETIFAALNYPKRFFRLFKESQIDKRHSWIPLSRLTHLSWQEQQEEYMKGAITLSKQAIMDCLDGRSPGEIGCVIFSSCTGFAPGPVIPHYLADEFRFAPDTFYTNVGSMGCESGFPGLKRAVDFVIANGNPALVVVCEICSATYFPEPDGNPDRENHFELMRANAVFADAAICALVGFDNDPRHPFIVDAETHTDTNYINDLGYTWRDGRLRVLLSPRLPEIAAKLTKIAVERLLQRHSLEPADIEHWVVHAAGRTVLDNIRDALNLPEEKLALSRWTLRNYGNTSATSVGITGKRLMELNRMKTGDHGLVVSVGAVLIEGATLLQWE